MGEKDIRRDNEKKTCNLWQGREIQNVDVSQPKQTVEKEIQNGHKMQTF